MIIYRGEAERHATPVYRVTSAPGLFTLGNQSTEIHRIQITFFRSNSESTVHHETALVRGEHRHLRDKSILHSQTIHSRHGQTIDDDIS